MGSIQEQLNKLREERIAREKARIEKLREINLKKYYKIDNEPRASVSNVALTKTVKSDIRVKNHLHLNGKRPSTAPTTSMKIPSKDTDNISKPQLTKPKHDEKFNKNDVKTNIKQSHEQNQPKPLDNKTKQFNNKFKPFENKTKLFDNKSKINMKPPFMNEKTIKDKPTLNKTEPKSANKRDTKMSMVSKTDNNLNLTRKSMLPQRLSPKPSTSKPAPNRMSVFERLYQPKIVATKKVDDIKKLQSNPSYLKKLIKDSGLIVNKRQTVFEMAKKEVPVRRSISAVHFKRINKSELPNCMHKWSSIGDKLETVHLKEVNEDAAVKEDKVVSAIKSDRKKVKFQTPTPNYNTPKPEELQSKLKNWLQKRGKSLESYHHLQCFGIHHLEKTDFKEFDKPTKFELYDDENKENVALESDSDDDSYTENMNDVLSEGDKVGNNLDKWRKASLISSGDMNESLDNTLTSAEAVSLHHVDELLTGALNDLTELLHEGFDWEQCARWLRAIRERFPLAPETAAYWECRAALEERRDDLPASLQCWEEAIAKGTERSVVEANLDHLLDKFMQLKISPNSGNKKKVDPKMVDVKNVFKSTIIRFAVQQAKLRKSQCETPKYTVTPVRRSARLSSHWSGKRTPLQICTSVRQAGLIAQPLQFVPNEQLSGTP